MTNSATVHEASTALSEWFEAFYSDIETFGADLGERVEFNEKKPGTVTQASSEALKARSVRFLNEHPLPDGCGAVFSRTATGSAEGVLEWWVRESEDDVARISFGTNPTGDRFYDYEQLEWFETAFGAKKRAIAGPYIDYLGVEEYIVTCMTPLIVHGDVLGVVGCDIRMGDLERSLMPMLRRIPGDAAILNPHGNVLVGNSGRFVSGDRVLNAPEGFVISPLNVSSMNLSLLHAA